MRSRREIGRTNQAVGSNFEIWIEGQHQKALYLGILAHVAHNQPSTKMIGGRLIYTEAGVADYTGVLDRSGKTLAVEAKSTGDDKLYRTVISPTQIKHLDAVAKAGGLALLLVEFRTDRKRFAIPWLEVPWTILRSSQSVTADTLSKWFIDPNPESCYLSMFYSPGPPTSKPRVFPRE